MRTKRLLPLMLCYTSLSAVGFIPLSSRTSAAEPIHQNACELNRTIKVTMKYLLYLPKDHEQKPSWPLMLFLHGSGERGDDLQRASRSLPSSLPPAVLKAL
jgi:poly(3-hydroxybutyrate) depolymerase